MNPGGLDSSEPELVPGMAFGRLAVCTGRERGEKTEAFRGTVDVNPSAWPLQTEF